MLELIPNLIQYVKSEQVHGGLVLFAAHNARCFDVPILSNELHGNPFHLAVTLLLHANS